MKKTVFTCDICGKDISRSHLRFYSWHHRLGNHYKFHMCTECYWDFKKYIKTKRGEKDVAES